MDEERPTFNAYELAAYTTQTPSNIPEYNRKIVALVSEWVSDTVYELEVNDPLFYVGVPSPDSRDTRTVVILKKYMLDSLNNDSQKRMMDEIFYYADLVDKSLDVYATWFYKTERLTEITAWFRAMTIPYEFDTALQRREKEVLKELHRKIPEATKRRDKMWFDNTRRFTDYCINQVV